MNKRALLSVTDKTGIVDLARGLVAKGWEVVSTGGTAKAIKDAGIPCTLVEEVTGFPEMLDGRVKTLHPKICGGILADRAKPAHMAKIAEHDIRPIDLVVVNLYAFSANPDIENIDIGGPTLLRSAAKNANSVIVVVDPADYDYILKVIDLELTETTRSRFAAKVFRHTANYDASIANWMERGLDEGTSFIRPAVSGH